MADLNKCDIAIALGYPADQDVNTVVTTMIKNGYYPCIDCWKVFPLSKFPDLDKTHKCKRCS